MRSFFASALIGLSSVFGAASASPMTYEITLTGTGTNAGAPVDISATGTFVWDPDVTVNFNDYCDVDCGSLPTLALVQEISFFIDQFSIGVGNSTSSDSFGLFSQQYGYLYFNGSALFGYCLASYAVAPGGSCEQIPGDRPSGSLSGTQAIFEGDRFGVRQFILAGSEWQFSGTSTGGFEGTASGSVSIQPVPIPAAFALFLSGVFGFGITRFKQ